MTYTWVIGLFTGEQAKKVKAHAGAGVGYFVRSERGRGMAYEVQAAFRRPDNTPVPAHLTKATFAQCVTLEKIFLERTK